jgi:hypothetical protein
VAAPINVAALPAGVKDGIKEADNTAATLVLYAPSKNRVSVIETLLEATGQTTPYQMNKTPMVIIGIRLTGLTPGTEYSFQYLVDGTLKIAEPYAEKILTHGMIRLFHQLLTRLKTLPGESYIRHC